MNPKVSIIVPVYNVAHSLSRCIESIRDQTLRDIEIILINDGSSDNSGDICDRYAAIDSRIRTLHKTNAGPGAARNSGINMAVSDYVGFVDSDDYIEPTMFEMLYKCAKQFDSQMAMCNYWVDTSDGTVSYEARHPLISNSSLDKQYIDSTIIPYMAACNDTGFFSMWNKIYQKQFLDKTGILVDETRSHGEDWWFNIQLFTLYDRISCIDDVLYHYLQSETGLYKKYREDYFDLCVDGRRKIMSVIAKYNMAAKSYDKRNLKFYYEFTSQICKILKNEHDPIKKKKLIMAILKNDEVIACCKRICQFTREELEQNGMSRRNKLMPYLISWRFYWVTYQLFQNEAFIEKLI